MLDMVTIKNLIAKQLKMLGYNTKVAKFTKFTFSISGSHGFRGEFNIESANAKRFELRVNGPSEDHFCVPCRPIPSGSGFRYTEKFYATKRFTKKEECISLVLEWLAGVVKTHAHLMALLHPELPLPDPHPFAEGTFVHFGSQTYPGHCTSVSVTDIVATKGHQIIHAVFDPASTPYFLMSLQARGANGSFVVTDGDVWHPALNIQPTEGPDANKKVYRVFPNLAAVETLRQLNQNDKALIHAAIQQYVHVNFSDKVDTEQ
jgi:hypothetical protein